MDASIQPAVAVTATTKEVHRSVKFAECQCPIGNLTQYEAKMEIDEIVRKSGFTLMGSDLTVFPGDGSGFTYLACIGESYIAISTYPEYLVALLDVRYCNRFGTNNAPKARKLMKDLKEFFGPRSLEEHPKQTWAMP